jgi:hemerythrin
MIALNKEMEVGVPMVDAQHKELVDRLNMLTSMDVKSVSKDETQKMLGLLGDYIVKHFSDEEILQKQSGYPKYDWHKNLHQLYVLEFNKLKKEFTENGVSAKFTSALEKSIIHWIVTHIKDVDVEFGKYYKEWNISKHSAS